MDRVNIPIIEEKDSIRFLKVIETSEEEGSVSPRSRITDLLNEICATPCKVQGKDGSSHYVKLGDNSSVKALLNQVFAIAETAINNEDQTAAMDIVDGGKHILDTNQVVLRKKRGLEDNSPNVSMNKNQVNLENTPALKIAKTVAQMQKPAITQTNKFSVLSEQVLDDDSAHHQMQIDT